MKKKTMAQLRKAANAAPKYVLHSDEFGYDIYIADEQLTNGSPITDKLEEALKYSIGFDQKEMKLHYWRWHSGLDLKCVDL